METQIRLFVVVHEWKRGYMIGENAEEGVVSIDWQGLEKRGRRPTMVQFKEEKCGDDLINVFIPCIYFLLRGMLDLSEVDPSFLFFSL